MSDETTNAETVELEHVRVQADVARRMRELVDEPTFGFQSLEHAVNVALYSFYNYKMRLLRRARGNEEDRR